MVWSFVQGYPSLVVSFLLVITLFIPSTLPQPSVINPCRLAKSRHQPKSTPFIRIVDELTGEAPDILLGSSGGHQGLPFYTLLPTTPTPIVVECSSGSGPVVWSYRGRGATSGVKVVPSTWTRPMAFDEGSLPLRPNCYSAALVISNVTDQLTGEYSCSVVEGYRDKKQVGNSFVLFVPRSAPFYHPEGDVVKVILASLQEPVLVLPCISRRRSGAGIGLYREIFERETNVTRLEKMELGPGIRYDPFIGFQLTPTRQLFDSEGTANFTCKFDRNLKIFPDLENRTLLRVLVHLRHEEKFAPESSKVSTFSLYFSWTSLSQPVIELEQRSGLVTPTEWQQMFTKNDFEEANSSASIFHLGSLHLNGEKGSEGTVTLRQKGNGQPIHSWQYKVLDKQKEPFVGLSYSHDPQEGYHHVFTCVLATISSPNFTFKNLMSDEVGDSTVSNYTVVECPDHPDQSLGCLILTTTNPVGEVTCTGDGVDTTVRYPLGFLEPSRPFFVERGQLLQLTVDEKDVVVTLPCLTNAPEASTFVHLFWKRNETEDKIEDWERVWPPAPGVDQAHVGIEFYPDWGFHLDTSNLKFSNPDGEYLCSSSGDFEDQSDAVRVIVARRGWSMSPKEESISGGLPYSLRWAWSGSEAIVVEEIGLRDHVKVKVRSRGERWTQAELVLASEIFETVLENDKIINVTLIQNGGKVHQWRFTKIPSLKNQGLTITTSWDHPKYTEINSSIEIICRGSPTMVERDRPRLSYYVCQNKDTCELIKKCQDKNCNHDQAKEEDTEDCLKENGCLRQVLKSFPLNGFLTAVCKYNGLTETGTVFDVFFREDVNWEFGSAEELVFLSANAATTEQNPAREVVDLGSNLVWELGESVTFSCGASPTTFTQGIRWALEDSEGTLHFHPQESHDPQWKYSAQTQILSTFTFHVTNFEVKKVWCFVPGLIDDNQISWKNLSQPIFIRGEIEENCHDTEPSIRLISVYPPPSVLFNSNFSLSEVRLDKLGSFVAPKGLIQLGIRVTTPEPIEWNFIQELGSSVAGPSSTPVVQSDRAMTNFYDPSTYCYTSKLLVNLRARNSEMDTGTYVASFGDKTLRFHLFVPSDKPPYLINAGKTINVTLVEGVQNGEWHLPCLLNNPNVGVKLFKQKSDWLDYDEVLKPSLAYDPSKGFTFTHSTEQELLGNWKCVAGENSEDFRIIRVLPAQQKKGGLKYELVGDIHVFTCNSESAIKPVLSLTSISKDDGISDRQPTFETKDCIGGCSIIMTTEPKGRITCLGDGVNATHILDQQPQDDSEAIPTSDTEGQTGIWYDSNAKAFKCRVNNKDVNSSATSNPSFVGVTCRRPMECRLLQQRLRGDGDHSQAAVEQCGPGCAQLKISERGKPSWSPNWFSAILRCNDIFAQFLQDRGVIVSATKESVTEFKRVRLDVVSFRREGSALLQVKLRCFANRYFYSRGISWGLEQSDGTLQFQDHSAASEVEVQSFNSIMSEIRLDLDEFQQFKRVWCFVPVLGSAKWANASISSPITALTPNLPLVI